MKNETLYGTDDERAMGDVGSYAEFKYALIRLYCRLFSTGMKNKWRRTYIDLYAGSGYSKIRNTQKVLLGSPLIALSVDDPFDKYILCEENPEFFRALQARVNERFSEEDVSFVEGNCNAKVEEIKANIPRGSLSLCFVDPYDLDVPFETLQGLASTERMDFLCLIATYMDAKRNVASYTASNDKIDRFLGTRSWRDDWEIGKNKGEDFAAFIAKAFSQQMETIGYIKTELHMMKEVRTEDRNVPLYHLALFSKSNTAFRYWEQVKKYSTPQRGLFDSE